MKTSGPKYSTILIVADRVASVAAYTLRIECIQRRFPTSGPNAKVAPIRLDV